MRPADHGAVAAIMPTAMSATGGQHIFNNAIFEEIFRNDKRIVGDALLQARLTLLANTGAAYQQISDTFLLFGDPATSLKLPVPRRPAGISVSRTAEGSNLIMWQESTDCDGDPVSGYNVYRRAATEQGFTKLNAELVTEKSYTDTTADAATLYYYAISAVDDDGYESARSLAVTPATTSSFSEGRAVTPDACFIQSAAGSVSFAGMWALFALLVTVAVAIRLRGTKAFSLNR
jgi:hypothetical protein